jgi:hypothetical protein
MQETVGSALGPCARGPTPHAEARQVGAGVTGRGPAPGDAKDCSLTANNPPQRLFRMSSFML